MFIVITRYYGLIIIKVNKRQQLLQFKTMSLCEFKERFSAFKDLETDFAIFSNPFSVNAEEVPQKYQMELIELQCNSKAISKNVDIETFHQSFHQCFGPIYPPRKNLASKTMFAIF